MTDMNIEPVEEITIKKALLDLDAFLAPHVEMIKGHVRYQLNEYWNESSPESWATEVIDLVELRVEPDFQKHLARRLMDEMEDMPLEAKKHLRKFFDLWT